VRKISYVIVVHFYRNVWTAVPTGKVKEVAAMLNAIHAQEDAEAAKQKARLIVEKLRAMKLAKAAEIVDNDIASAILDRLLHHSTTINIKGESYRLKEKESRCGHRKAAWERGSIAPKHPRGSMRLRASPSAASSRITSTRLYLGNIKAPRSGDVSGSSAYLVILLDSVRNR
jgi:hypothetical protein